MTGGGGGCCRDGAAKLVHGGFTAVHLTADGGFVISAGRAVQIAAFGALANDEELNRYRKNAIIREGGVLPNIHAVLLPKKSEEPAPLSETETFDQVFVEMIKKSKHNYLVDPRDGLHKCIESERTYSAGFRSRI